MSSCALDKIYGRKEVLALIKKRVLGLKEGYRQNIALLGGRYIGKSVVLHKFIADLDDKDVIAIYVDIEHRDLEYLCHKLMGSLLLNFSRSRGLPLYGNIDLLLESTQECLPQTAKAVKKVEFYLAHGKGSDAYRELLALPQVFARESGKFCVVILDEFDQLENIGVPEVFQELGRKIMTQKRCLYMVTSSLPGPANKILTEKLSLLFGNFEIVPVEPFDSQNSREFVSLLLHDVQVAETLRDFIVDFTGGHPLYIQLICQELLNLSAIHRQEEVFRPLLAQAIENVLFNQWGVLNRHFELVFSRICSGKGDLVVARILFSLANGRRKIKDLAYKVGLKQGAVNQKIARLTEMGIVAKNGNYYFICDRLMRYWIKYVNSKDQLCVELEAGARREAFYQDLARAIDVFNVNAKKDLAVRIMELLSCFENEAFQINGRRYKLSLFNDIVTKKSGQAFDSIKASTVDGEWFIVLKQGAFGENDINMVLSESKKMQRRPQRCVLISLSEFEENARVKALQERMWLWNTGELNALLDLYDKPYIVH